MQIRIPLAFLPLILATGLLHAATPGLSEHFSVSSRLHIPGETLKEGDYTVRILNTLSDRVILEVDDSHGKARATFIGVPNKTIPKPLTPGAVTWANPARKNTYVKGWSFPESPTVIEAVYPKAEAVAIATANPAKVLAVDPASEGKVADKSLSEGDMHLLTLWLLSLQQVGPGAPTGGIRAERYQLTASADYKPSINALPHTASLMPLVWLAGGLAAFIAFCLRIVRLARPRSVKSAYAEKG